ncbi:dynein axonemal assembly factor 4 [Salarias fasciatus]|uniref:dynein axonemal assembly factor 4 n=1 Tax=Salarias fasciatus TaxID=181472 RepID=UPI0011764BA8|nr:dynein assembly factor 4, axonemal [Salarias fasciatus]
MPLLVSDFCWSQTDSTVHISVPLKGARADMVDVLCTEEYLKVHFPPYLFEAFLYEPVLDHRSSAKLGNGVALFNLPKKTERVWEDLMKTSLDKEQKQEVRRRALQKHQEKVSSEDKQKAERRQAERKFTLQTTMKLEQEERENIQKMKEVERQKTSEELEAWQQRLKDRREERRVTGGVTPGSCNTKVQKNAAELPPPRSRGNIQVSFTPRVFPTALRESRVAEEEEWLQKQAEARRALGADVEQLQDLTEAERNPDWLKEKGDKRFTAGDYHGAVNAYNLAIRLNSKIPALYSNRAACHLKLGNLHKVVEDASQALQLLTPPVAANAAARVRASVRRGSAFCQLQLYAEGLQDFQTALKIDPDNEALQRDVQKIRDIMQGSAHTHTHTHTH